MRTRSSTSTTTRAAPPCTTRPPSRPPPGGPGARWPGLRRRAFRLIAVSSRDNLSRLPGPHRADDRELVPEYSGAHYCEEAGKITQDSARPIRLAGFVVSSGCSPTTACDHVSAPPLRKTDIPGAGGGPPPAPPPRPGPRANTTPPPRPGNPGHRHLGQAR